jgi:DNA-binding MarR family transcriptional regulator
MHATTLRRPLDDSVIHLLHRACQLADVVFAEEVENSGLTPRQFAVLLAISHNKDVSQTALVSVTGIDRSTLAEIVKRLLKRGLIKRRRTRLDARAYAVRLTDEGIGLLDKMEPAAKRADTRLLTAFDVKSQQVLIGALATLIAAFPPAK